MRNQGELPEGWYDPATKKRADAATEAPLSPIPELATTRRRGSPDYGAIAPAVAAYDESDDEFGPALPTQTVVGHVSTGSRGYEKRVGPAIPNVQDLEYRDGMLEIHCDHGNLLTIHRIINRRPSRCPSRPQNPPQTRSQYPKRTSRRIGAAC